MCRRKKEPHKGLWNFVGGKIERRENHQDAAYRELWEETSISSNDISLVHVMDFTYPLENSLLEVYCGVLEHVVDVCGDENMLNWIPVSTDFTDVNQFAGFGNIYHIMSYIASNFN